MGMFGEIGSAKTYGAGKYIAPGTHELEVHEVSTFESSQHAGRHYMCVEADVIATTCEDHTPGERVSWLVNLQQPSAMSNCLGFALSLDPEAVKADITEAFMERLCSEEQPARGLRVRAMANVIQTRAGNDFTKVTWEAAATA